MSVSTYSRYTREVLEPLVKTSQSVSEVLRKLGLVFAGGTHRHVSQKIIRMGLDTSHFLGRRSNRGERHKGGPSRRTPRDILKLKLVGNREKAHRLRRALIESGVPYICATCGLAGIWCGKKLTLEIHHKNSNILDDRKKNLEFQCPNCHSQKDY